MFYEVAKRRAVIEIRGPVRVGPEPQFGPRPMVWFGPEELRQELGVTPVGVLDRSGESDRLGHASENYHRSEDFASLHFVEGLFDVVEADGFGHESVEVETTLEIEVDQHREVARGETVAVPR